MMDGSVRIEKLMSLAPREFQLSLAPIAGVTLVGSDYDATLVVGQGQVIIVYEPRAPIRLGGLLDMPQALVSLTFVEVTPAERVAVLARFDLAFRRGGG